MKRIFWNKSEQNDFLQHDFAVKKENLVFLNPSINIHSLLLIP